jgi:UDP-galactopyranose mutase
MARFDVIVVGGGISGASFAWAAAREGKRALVVEKEPRLGGCLHSERTGAGYWFELAGHTCYNSYLGLTDIVQGSGLRGKVLQRARTHLRFLQGDTVVPGSNQWALLRLMDKVELMRSLPRAFGAKKDGQTVYSYYARILGRGNYNRVFGPVLSAVPSQSADSFPADMLFKVRKTRRKDFPRSFTVEGGLQRIVEAALDQPQVTTAVGQGAARVERVGDGFSVALADGTRHDADTVAIAVPPRAAADLVRDAAPELAAQLARIKEAVVETVGVVVRAEKVHRIPISMFLVPLDDMFHSIVTRDSVPDPAWRSFSFHFKPGHPREARMRRILQVLEVTEADLDTVVERTAVLPSPELGHEKIVEEIDRLTAGGRLCITGNYFAGLSIEDCVVRSREQWARVRAG